MKQYTNIKSLVADIEALGDKYLVREVPFQLPVQVKDFIVKVAQYVAWIEIILLSFALILQLLPVPFGSFGTIGFIAQGGSDPRFWGIVHMLTASPILIFLFLLNIYIQYWTIKWEYKSLSGLKARSRTGWEAFFYGHLLGFVSGILGIIILGYGGYGRAILIFLLRMYLWFQVKDRYTSHHKV
jgi:hypothetical protein